MYKPYTFFKFKRDIKNFKMARHWSKIWTQNSRIQIKRSKPLDFDIRCQWWSCGAHISKCLDIWWQWRKSGVHIRECVEILLEWRSFGVHIMECVEIWWESKCFGAHIMECVDSCWQRRSSPVHIPESLNQLIKYLPAQEYTCTRSLEYQH